MDSEAESIARAGGMWPALAALVLVALSVRAGAADVGVDGDPSGAIGEVIEVELDQSFDAPETVPPGEPVRLDVVVTHPPGTRVRSEPALEESQWHHVATDRKVERTDGRPTTTLELTLQVLRVGATTLEPIEIVVTGSNGGRRTLRTDPVDLRVSSVLEDDDQPTFKPARPPRTVWVHDYTLAWVGGGGAAVLLLGLVALGFLFREDEPIAAAAPSKPPEQEALDALDELAESDLLERGDVVYFYVRMSQTLRRYLGRRFGFPGTEWTTSEILERMRRTAWEGEVTHDAIADWMRRVDLVKFTDRVPSSDRAREALAAAKRIVRETRPPEVDE